MQDQNHQKLWDLFKEYDDFIYLTHPELATFEGFHLYDDRLSDLSDENVKHIFNSNKTFLKKLSAINYEALDNDDKLNYDMFKYGIDAFLKSEPFDLHYSTIWQQGGLQIGFATLAQFQPCSYDDEALKYLKRIEGFDKQVSDTIGNQRLGMGSGIVMPDFIIQQTLPQFENLHNTEPEDSIFYLNCKNSDDIHPEIKQQILNSIKGKIYPSYKRLYDFIKHEYLPKCRREAGIWSLPDGEERYKHFIKDFTSLELAPEEIHKTGLEEVARIKAEMEQLINDIKFKGTIEEFNHYLRTDPSFYFTDKNDLLDGYRKILNKMDSRLPDLFGRLPETGYDLREIEEYMAETAPAAYYFPAPEDGKRPGYFYVNTFNLNARPKYEMTALALHEAVPGHHLQIALAQELKNLPKFRRDWSGATSYVEGWALYSESLGYQTGMYDDPYQRYGALSLEVWRACRLVVDTGLHHKKWSRGQAVEYMKSNTPNSEHDIRTEVDRYIAWPGQALAYKIGELKIKELKKYAETSLNSSFNIKDFHDTLLKNGALPLSYLEKIVHSWVKEFTRNP